MNTEFLKRLDAEMESMRSEGLYKLERIIESPQSSRIIVQGREVVNLCANNYLGLSSHPEVIAAAHRGLDERGFGMSSVRFICGTQDIHRELEKRIAAFVGTDDAILYSSCFDANAGLFETLLGAEDVIISDALNHASIIDGVRLSKARRSVYPHGDMVALEAELQGAGEARVKLIATDGVFSMDGDLARLDEICRLADKYDALVMVDDSHATGFIGPHGKGTPEHFGVQDRVDIVTSTLGKALGGASGGFTAGRAEIVRYLRQRSRPYLFSNSVAPSIVYACIAAIDLIERDDTLRGRVMENTAYFRKGMKARGFPISDGFHPIVPIMLGDATLAVEMARELLDEGVYVIGFSFPVVPKGKARIRAQISAAHTIPMLDQAMDAFARVGKRHKVM